LSHDAFISTSSSVYVNILNILVCKRRSRGILCWILDIKIFLWIDLIAFQVHISEGWRIARIVLLQSSFWVLQRFKLWKIIHCNNTLCIFICHLSCLEAVLRSNLLILVEVWVIDINDIAQLCFLQTTFNELIDIILSRFERYLCSWNLWLSDSPLWKFSLSKLILNLLRHHKISTCLIVVHLKVRIIFRKWRHPLFSHLECWFLVHLLLHLVRQL